MCRHKLDKFKARTVREDSVPNFAANLSMMFQDIDFLDRFDAAARAGFKGVEFLFPYDHPPEAIAERLDKNRLTLALFNTVPGDWAGGERGLAALPGREQEFRDGVDTAIRYAKAALAGVPRPVIRQARKYLEMLEEQSLRRGGQDDLFLNEKKKEEPEIDALRETLQGVNPDELTPREALEILYRLKKLG